MTLCLVLEALAGGPTGAASIALATAASAFGAASNALAVSLAPVSSFASPCARVFRESLAFRIAHAQSNANLLSPYDYR